ncbi:hypothetical protein LXM50_03285 [Microbacterium sp. Au-Mic1]|uniref:hypothetical protein n=1 Tax=Microbacterium sp. Au-Mic1 TaxID=2906457 RepID=UPI001E5F3C61|nr:hypothetical protein [Microbacterium sp. Au-Mic1]MCE4024992.1 hypothetical protein [Microbacterium sp. Au-Mic1]
MTTDPDDALRWEGDEPDAPDAAAKNAPPAAPQAQTSAGAAPEPAHAVENTAGAPVARAETTSADDAEDADDEPAAIGNVALVFYGIIGGVYLLFAVGWIVGGFRLRPRASLLLVDWMYFPWMWLATLAPVLWFATAWVLTRGRATWIRVVALIAGAALLVPWPFVMFGTVGA